MEHNGEILSVFKEIHSKNIDYVVMKAGYEEIFQTKGDIDLLLLNKSHANALESIFYSQGFTKVKRVYKKSGYFFKKLTLNGIITFHIQEEIFFINRFKKITYIDINDFLRANKILVNDVNFLNDMVNSLIYIGRLKYEDIKFKAKYKNCISKCFSTNDLNELFSILDKAESSQFYKRNENIFFSITINKIMYKVKFILRNLFVNQNILVQGVDGTGKSSTIDKLSRLLGNNVKTQYMGRKLWETNFAKRRLDVKKDRGTLQSLINIISLYYEMFIRIKKYYFQNKVVLYDRYPNEIHLNEKGFRKLVFRIIFDNMFPKPRYRFYLECPIEKSIQRKSDIQSHSDIEKLRDKKAAFAKYVQKEKDIIRINTGELSQDKVIENIIYHLPPEFVKNL